MTGTIQNNLPRVLYLSEIANSSGSNTGSGAYLRDVLPQYPTEPSAGGQEFYVTTVTACTMPTIAEVNAVNRDATRIYKFTADDRLYEEIFSRQCVRVSTFIDDHLSQLDRRDDDYNEEIVDKIAAVIDLVGEPAYMTAAIEAMSQQDKFLIGKLLLAIATSKSKETEIGRTEFLRRFLGSTDYRIKNVAVKALGRLNNDESKKILQEFSTTSGRSEAAQLAASLIR